MYMSKVFIIILTFNIKLSQVIAVENISEYSHELAKSFFTLCAESYFADAGNCIHKRLPDTFGSYFLYRRKTIYCDDNNNECSFYIIISNETQRIIAVFTGSLTITQILSQATSSFMETVDFNGLGKIGNYYYNSFEKLWPLMNDVFSVTEYTNYNFFSVGHSLGGALASLAAFYTHHYGHKKSEQIIAYTFGAPKVGTLKFSRSYNQRIPYSFRVVYGVDLVPQLPPCSDYKILEYVNYFTKIYSSCDINDDDSYFHQGIKIFYSKNKDQDKYEKCAKSPDDENSNCYDEFSFFYYLTSDYLRDHDKYFNGYIILLLEKLHAPANDNCEIDMETDDVRDSLTYFPSGLGIGKK